MSKSLTEAEIDHLEIGLTILVGLVGVSVLNTVASWLDNVDYEVQMIDGRVYVISLASLADSVEIEA